MRRSNSLQAQTWRTRRVVPVSRDSCRAGGWATILVLLLAVAGCASAPTQTESMDYRARAETQVEGAVRVSAVVLSPAESLASFGVPLAKKNVQPVWLEIVNEEATELFLMLLSVDREYFTPSEVAWRFKGKEGVSFDDRIDALVDRHVSIIIPPHSTVSGYVYTNLDPGAKVFSVDLFGSGVVRSFEFAQFVPGLEADFSRVDFDRLHAEGAANDLDLAGLRTYLEGLPCCVLGGDRKTAGDPLNLVIVGDGLTVLTAMVRRGWDLTETIRGATKWRTAFSSAFGSKYRTSPVSPLYLFDRPQDIALQKVRGNVDQRNHLRMWRAPVTVNGQMVWVGQVSRDIGVKFSSKTLVTHKVDPIIDEARLYLTLDMLSSESLKAVGYVDGVGYSGRDAPRHNYTDDPYYTDGLRVVLICGDGRYDLEDLEHLPWKRPPGRIAWDARSQP
jgi:hypothetical protein